MNLMICADLHLTDNPRDAYRLGIFDWLAAQASLLGANHIIILGDLTESKDRHSAVLANVVADGLRKLDDAAPVIILMGNHDYVDPQVPFFRWMRHAGVEFMTEPKKRTLGDSKCLFLPHTRVTRAYGDGFRLADYDYIFAHQTFTGVRGSNGARLEGLPAGTFAGCRGRIYSGDIHVPQRLANIEYVGSPYHVYFGDEFVPRVVFDDGRSTQDVNTPFPARRKIVLDGVDRLGDLRVNAGDMIKFDIRLKRTDFHQWDECRRRVMDFCERARVVLSGCRLVERDAQRLAAIDLASKRLPPVELFDRFCSRNPDQVNDILREAGRECLGSH